MEVINSEIAKLLNKRVIVECEDCPGQFISNIFVREKKDGNFRMILNLSVLNESVEYKKFKMETLQSIVKLLRPDCFMASLDLKDAYYSVPIAEEHQLYLRFRWNGKLYQFTCFPNGLSSAPRKFTKLLKPVLAHLRLQGFVNAIYIDDTYLQGETETECRENVLATRQLLTRLGFTINLEKSVQEPTQQLRMLGFILDSRSMTVRLTEEKVKNIRTLCQNLIDQRCFTLQTLAEVIGKLCASFPGVEFGPLHYRGLEHLKCSGLKLSRGHYTGKVQLTLQARDDLNWWINHVHFAHKQISHGDPLLSIETDASKNGWGATCNGTSTGGRWDKEEAQLHINGLEMKAAFFGLKCFASSLTNSHVRLFVDNTTTVSYISAMGGMKSAVCNDLAQQIWAWCIERDIWLSVCHIPGKLNVDADQASRQFNDRTEWMLDRSIFSKVTNKLFSPKIDLFASRLNTQLPRFVSWHPDPGAESVDAFMRKWDDSHLYLFPHFSLIGRCLQKVAQDRTPSCLIIAPLWPTQTWFTHLLSMLVDTPVLLPHRNLLTLPGTSKSVAKPMKLQLIACHCSGMQSKVNRFLMTLQSSSSHLGAKEHSNNMGASLRNGQPIVVKGKLMYFKPL